MCAVVAVSLFVLGVTGTLEQHIGLDYTQLLLSAIIANSVTVLVLLTQMYNHQKDAEIRLRPWLGRNSELDIVQDEHQAGFKSKIPIRNFGSLPGINITVHYVKISDDSVEIVSKSDMEKFVLLPTNTITLIVDAYRIPEGEEQKFKYKERKFEKYDLKSAMDGCVKKFRSGQVWFGLLIEYESPSHKIRGSYFLMGRFIDGRKRPSLEITRAN